MSNIIQGPQIGEVVKDGKVIRKDYQTWCGACAFKRKINWADDSEENKKLLKKFEMKDYMIKDKTGLEIRGKSCPNCSQTVKLWEEENGNEPQS